MSKFHVGDNVRVFTDDAWNGRTGHVNSVSSTTTGRYDVTIDTTGEDLSFDESELRPAIISPQNDVVNHPSHYTSGLPEGVEVIDIIRAQNGTWEHSNAIKYILRAQYKGTHVQDLRKAVRYLTWEIERLEADK